jgi:hypoxanthine phosphoribosyltransferase
VLDPDPRSRIPYPRIPIPDGQVTPRRSAVDDSRGILEVEWPFFGELSRALALKVARAYDPELVIGIATAGVVPGAVIAAILGREFHSMVVSRRFGASTVRDTPRVFGAAPTEVRGRRVLIVDETCDGGDTLRLAVSAAVNGGAADVRTAVGFRTGPYEPDFSGLETESMIILPWDREVLVDGELVLKPEYAEALKSRE